MHDKGWRQVRECAREIARLHVEFCMAYVRGQSAGVGIASRRNYFRGRTPGQRAADASAEISVSPEYNDAHCMLRLLLMAVLYLKPRRKGREGRKENPRRKSGGD